MECTGVINSYYSNPHHSAAKAGMASGQPHRSFADVKNEAVNHFTLHYFDGAEGEHALAATTLADGGSVTVYKTLDYDASDPSYLVKYWDAEGNVQQTNVKLEEVNPEHAGYLEMLAYAVYSNEQGYTDNAFGDLISSASGTDGSQSFGVDELFVKKDFKKLVKDYMQMQYDAGNLSGYLSYKKLYDYMMQS